MFKTSEVLSYLGNYKRQGAELVFQCPVCARNGGDRSKDNLKFNEKKGFLTCFADPEHSKEIRKAIRKQREVIKNG